MCNQNHQAELNSQPAACGLTYCVVTQKKKRLKVKVNQIKLGCQNVKMSLMLTFSFLAKICQSDYKMVSVGFILQ